MSSSLWLHILLLALFHFSHVFGLASEVDVSHGERGIKVDGDRKRFLSGSYDQARNKSEGSQEQDKKHIACADPEPDDLLPTLTTLGCMERYVMTKIVFAEYGNPTGECGHFRHGTCGAPATFRLVKKNCLGKNKCNLFATDEMFGPSHCKGVARLKVEAICTKTS